MNKFNLRAKLYGTAMAAILAFGLTSCDNWVYDDLDPCTVTYRLKFTYDYNMKYADAFPAEVRSVNVWAFDSEGRLAWQGKASGASLADKDFYLTMDVAPGTYSFLAWGGLSGQDAFTVADATRPASMRNLGCTLNLKERVQENEDETRADGDAPALYSDYKMMGLYHGILDDVTLTVQETEHVVQDMVIPMMKDTKRVAVMLQHLDGSAIERGDFSVSIEAANSLLAWDNAVLPGPEFSYTPWSVTYGQTTALTPGGDPDGTITTIASHLSELSTSRIMADSGQRLKVRRNSDGRTIINVPFVQYLLLVKGNYNENLSDQEYLDRMDDFSMVFFLNPNDTWYSAIGVYINSWAVVPPQEENDL